MRKLVGLMLAFAFVVSLFSAQEALAAKAKKKGTVKSIDEKAGTVTFMFEGENDPTTLAVSAEDMKGVAEGDNVRVDFEDSGCSVVNRVKKERKITVPVGC